MTAKPAREKGTKRDIWGPTPRGQRGEGAHGAREGVLPALSYLWAISVFLSDFELLSVMSGCDPCFNLDLFSPDYLHEVQLLPRV